MLEKMRFPLMDIPGDRNGEFKTSVVPRGKQYKEDVVRDCGILFLAGVRTRPLFMISGWRLFSRNPIYPYYQELSGTPLKTNPHQ